MFQRRAATKPQWMQFLSAAQREKLTEQFSVFGEKSQSLSIIHLLVSLYNKMQQKNSKLWSHLSSVQFLCPRCEDGGVLEGSPLIFCDGSRWNGSAPHCMRKSKTIFSLLIVLWRHTLMKSADFLGSNISIAAQIKKHKIHFVKLSTPLLVLFKGGQFANLSPECVICTLSHNPTWL